ncbi:MAG: HU family DNA-binding protein [Duncaniella sp.]|nr:HU family DNA-binding protein [Duncaniella sp.]
MDNKTFITKLAKRLEREPAEISTLAEGLCNVFIQAGNDLDSVAIPGFGVFKSSKRDELIVTDEATGKRMLLPPAIVMEFQPSIVLRKKLAK